MNCYLTKQAPKFPQLQLDKPHQKPSRMIPSIREPLPTSPCQVSRPSPGTMPRGRVPKWIATPPKSWKLPSPARWGSTGFHLGGILESFQMFPVPSNPLHGWKICTDAFILKRTGRLPAIFARKAKGVLWKSLRVVGFKMKGAPIISTVAIRWL